MRGDTTALFLVCVFVYIVIPHGLLHRFGYLLGSIWAPFWLLLASPGRLGGPWGPHWAPKPKKERKILPKGDQLESQWASFGHHFLHYSGKKCNVGAHVGRPGASL